MVLCPGVCWHVGGYLPSFVIEFTPLALLSCFNHICCLGHSFLSRPEATSKSQILTAQAVAEDVGRVVAAQSGIDLWADCGLTHSERDVQRVVAKQGTKLDIPISRLQLGNQEIPWLNPRDWMEWLVRKGLWPTFGGAEPNQYDVSDAVWATFWDQYEKVCPDFELFSHTWIDKSKCAAFMVHGDEGRSLKRQGILVTSLQSCLGKGFDSKRLRRRGPGGNWQHKVNFIGHSYTHRYFTSVIPKVLYEGDQTVFHGAMEELALALKSLYWDGFVDPATGCTYRIAIIAVKGDAPYLAKNGKFFRSYNTAVKRGDARTLPKGVCHRCLAGTVGFPCEELGTVNPRWFQTRGVKLPWVTVPPLVKHLIHNVVDPSTFYQTDVWHIVHLGFGRSWIASCVSLLLEVIPAANLDSKWKFLTVDYKAFCKANRRQTHVSAITPYLMSYQDRTGTMGQWHKGSLTATLMVWLEQFIAKMPTDSRNLLPTCREATLCLNALFDCLYRADAFLTVEQSNLVTRNGLRFLSIYQAMAVKQFQAGRPYNFPLYPKLHSFHEILLTTRSDTLRSGTAASPLLYGCQIDEDVVGRTSRLSRRVSARLTMQRTLERYLVSAHGAFANSGMLSR